MCKLTKMILTMVDEKDPAQKLLGLLAQATDNEFCAIKADLKELKKINEEHYQALERTLADNISKLTASIEQHNNRCPFGMENRTLELEKQVKELDFIFVIKKYKLIAILIGLGILFLTSIGAKDLITQIASNL